MKVRDIIPWKSKEVALSRSPASEMEDPLALFQRRMDSMFSSLWDGSPLGRDLDAFGGFSPRVEVSDGDREITVTAELPGLDEKDVEVSLDDRTLTIVGEKKHEREETRGGAHYSERSFGRFQRVLHLPAQVEEESVKATFRKGVLTLRLPKARDAESRRIKIET